MKRKSKETEFLPKNSERDWRSKRVRGKRGRKRRGRKMTGNYQSDYQKYVPKRNKRRWKQSSGSGDSEYNSGDSESSNGTYQKKRNEFGNRNNKKFRENQKKDKNISKKILVSKKCNSDIETSHQIKEKQIKIDSPVKSRVEISQKTEKPKSQEFYPSEDSQQRSRCSKISLILTPMQIKDKRKSARNTENQNSNFKVWNSKKVFDSDCSSANTNLSEGKEISKKSEQNEIDQQFMTPHDKKKILKKKSKAKSIKQSKIGTEEIENPRVPKNQIFPNEIESYQSLLRFQEKETGFLFRMMSDSNNPLKTNGNKIHTPINNKPNQPSLLKCSFPVLESESECQERNFEGISQCFLNSKYYDSQSGSENGKNTFSSFNSQSKLANQLVTSFSNNTLSSNPNNALPLSKDNLPQISEMDSKAPKSLETSTNKNPQKKFCEKKKRANFEDSDANESGLQGGFCLMNFADEDQFLKSNENPFHPHKFLHSESRISGLNLHYKVSFA